MDVESRLEDLENAVFSGQGQSLPYPLDSNSQQAIIQSLNPVLVSNIFDIFWKNNLHFSTIFESSAGYSTNVTGSGTVTVDGGGLLLHSGATNNSVAQMARLPNPTGESGNIRFFTFQRPQRFRTDIAFSATTHLTAYVVRGEDIVGGNNVYFGFKYISSSGSNGVLYGVVNNGGSETTIALATLASNTTYIVEADFLPAQRVDFKIRNNATGILETKGTLTTNLPAKNTSLTDGFFAYYLKCTEAANKEMYSTFFEYAQNLNNQ
jgi:hypothetical protein